MKGLLNDALSLGGVKIQSQTVLILDFSIEAGPFRFG